jgi:5-methylcytosine-specific restriction endonuclease McrA
MPSRIPTFKPPRLRAPRTTEHYSSRSWSSIRKAVLLRDVYRCASCRRIVDGPDAQVDHMLPLSEGGTDDLANLQTLCIGCHSRKTMGEIRRKGLR